MQEHLSLQTSGVGQCGVKQHWSGFCNKVVKVDCTLSAVHFKDERTFFRYSDRGLSFSGLTLH